MQVSESEITMLVAKAREMLKDYKRGDELDTWDAVMINDTDGYDVNVWSDGNDEPLRVCAYAVSGLTIVNTYSVYRNITQEVLHKFKINSSHRRSNATQT
jgi:hypothetical protein